MVNLKLDELICLTGWQIAYVDGQKDSSESNASEKEKNIVRSMRNFFKMDADRFNQSLDKYELNTGHLIELEDKDPITKIIARFLALQVAFEENEDGVDKSNLSNKELEYIKKIDDLIKIEIIHDDIKDKAYGLVNKISDSGLLKQGEYLDTIFSEKEQGIFWLLNVDPLLRTFFDSLEKNNLFIEWEDNYLAFIKYKPELRDIFGEIISLLSFDKRYKALKPLISNQKKDKIAKEKQFLKEKIEQQKNKIHEYSISNGIDYCRYCGKDKSWNKINCRRENGHKYTIKRIKKISYSGYDTFEYVPICKNCGNDDGFYDYKCK